MKCSSRVNPQMSASEWPRSVETVTDGNVKQNRGEFQSESVLRFLTRDVIKLKKLFQWKSAEIFWRYLWLYFALTNNDHIRMSNSNCRMYVRTPILINLKTVWINANILPCRDLSRCVLSHLFYSKSFYGKENCLAFKSCIMSRFLRRLAETGL